MPFEHGSVGFQAYNVPGPLPDDVIDRFAAHAAPPPDTVGETEIRGWVTGRHLLDRNITEESAYRGAYLRLTLQQAQRKIPPALLRAECRMEEMAAEAAGDRQWLPRQQRNEIRRAVADRLLPSMPPQIKGIDFCQRRDEILLFAASASVVQSDIFAAAYREATGYGIRPFCPEDPAMFDATVDAHQWHPVSFSSKVPNERMELFPGRDFLTWLWYRAEEDNSTPPQLLVEGPLTLVHEGNGAHETLLRKGEPTASAEAKAGLLGGKKLRRAKINLTDGEQVWSAMVDADTFAFRGLRLPKIEDALDAVSFFEERMGLLETFWTQWTGLYREFAALRCRPDEWHALVRNMREWIDSRSARA